MKDFIVKIFLLDNICGFLEEFNCELFGIIKKCCKYKI